MMVTHNKTQHAEEKEQAGVVQGHENQNIIKRTMVRF